MFHRHAVIEAEGIISGGVGIFGAAGLAVVGGGLAAENAGIRETVRLGFSTAETDTDPKRAFPRERLADRLV